MATPLTLTSIANSNTKKVQITATGEYEITLDAKKRYKFTMQNQGGEINASWSVNLDTRIQQGKSLISRMPYIEAYIFDEEKITIKVEGTGTPIKILVHLHDFS